MTATEELSARRTRSVLVVAACVLIIDLVTKIWAVAALDDRNIDVVWKLRLHLVSNTGFAFSTGEGLGPLLGVLAVVIAIALWRFRHQMQTAWGAAALGMVMGGAIGNLVDRIFRGDGFGRGGVVDFIDFQFWPVFNVADAAIVVGVGVLLMYFWLHDRRESTTAPAGP